MQTGTEMTRLGAHGVVVWLAHSQSMHGVLPLIVSSVPGRAPSPSPSSAVDGTMSLEGDGSVREDHETPPTSPEVDRESETKGGVWGRLRRSVKV